MKTKTKYYYLSLNKRTNKAVIHTSRAQIGERVGIDVRTIFKYIKKNGVYSDDEWLVLQDVPLQKIRRGFAVKH